MFNIGDRVVCIDDDFTNFLNSLSEDIRQLVILPKKDATYTIRDIFKNDGIVVSVVLEEIHNVSFLIPLLGNIRRELSFAYFRFALRQENIVSENVEIEELEYVQ